MTFWLLIVGLLSLLAQVVLLRELNVAFYGSELIYILGLGAWLLGTAAGALPGRRYVRPTPARLRRLLLLLALVLLLTLIEVRGIRRLWGGVPGADLPFGRQVGALLLALVPTAALLGRLFRSAAVLAMDDGSTLARAYAVESAGALAGGALATLLLAVGVGNLTTGLLACLIAAGAATAVRRAAAHAGVARAGAGYRSRTTVTAALLGLLLLLLLAAAPSLDRRLTAWNHPHLTAVRDTPYGRVAVSERAGQLAVFVDDDLVFESEGTAAEEFAHLAALQCARPESLLVLGGAAEGLAVELLQHDPAALVLLELDGELLATLRPRLPAATVAALAHPAVELRLGDARRELARTGRYDLILSAMPEPDSGRANRFFTREFFTLCAAHLRPGGVLALRLEAAENLWPAPLVRRTGSIHRALREVFADVVALPGPSAILLASPEPLARDPDLLARRFRERELATRLVSPAYLDYLYTNDRFAEVASLLAGAATPANTDLRPVCYPSTLLLWLSRFFPGLAVADWPGGGGAAVRPAALAVAATLLLVLSVRLLLRRRPDRRRAIVVGIAGGAGMVLETVLILAYQVRNGVLFQDLGLLLTAFMAGLALGALVVEREGWRARRHGAGLLAGLGLLGAATAGLLAAGLAGGPAAAGTLLLLSGSATAALFAHAGLASRGDPRGAVGPLYAADLAGGCLGALLASLLLVPVAGLAGTALLVALVAALGCLLL